jgi:cell division protein FtsI/penicillin-binding protein 2
VSFYQANIPRQSEKSNTPKTIFLFLNTIFLFFIIAAASKKNLVIIKKDTNALKKEKSTSHSAKTAFYSR